MEVILLEKIRNLGDLGDQIKVKSGFGRNYLLPYGKAVIANAENKAKFEARRAELENVQKQALEEARERGGKLGDVTVQIVRKLTEEGRLFGSVGTKDITDALAQAGFQVSKSEIQLSQGPIKEVGDHTILVSFHPEVTIKIIVSVVGEA